MFHSLDITTVKKTIKIIAMPNRNIDLKSLRSLFILSAIFALLPFYSFRHKKLKISIFYKLHLVITHILAFSGLIFLLYTGLFQKNVIRDMDYIIFDIMQPCTYILINIYYTITINCVNFKNAERLMNNLLTIDRYLYDYHKIYIGKLHVRTNKLYYFELVCAHIHFVLWISFSFESEHEAIDKNVFILPYTIWQRYNTYVVTILIYNFLWCIVERCKSVNDLFVILTENTKNEKSKYNIPRSYNFETISELIIFLNETVKDINKMYGWTLLFMYFDVLVALARAISFITKETDYNYYISLFLLFFWKTVAFVSIYLLYNLHISKAIASPSR